MTLHRLPTPHRKIEFGKFSFLLLILAAAMLLSGCAAMHNMNVVKNGPGYEFDPDRVRAAREVQDRVLIELYLDAGLPPGTTPVNANDWMRVIEAGMNYADSRCEEYLHALFRLNRDRKTTVSQIGLLGTATAGVMAAVESAAKELAIVAIAFGLASGTVDNLSSNVLYDLEPSSVRTIVKGMQQAYRDNLGIGYSTKPAAVAAIRGYAALCVPANIEAEVNLAVKKAEPDTVKAEPTLGRPPVVTHAPVVTSTARFGPDQSSALLDAFVNPAGKLDTNNERRLQAYLQARGIQASTTTFIFGAPHAEERRRAAQFFGLK
jgi:hypothetical protein